MTRESHDKGSKLIIEISQLEHFLERLKHKDMNVTLRFATNKIDVYSLQGYIHSSELCHKVRSSFEINDILKPILIYNTSKILSELQGELEEL